MSYPLPSIGIDFGTSSCCMAWVPPGSQVAEVIRNAEGRETTPTILYYGDEPEPLVGEPAAEMAAQEEDGYKAIHSIKRDLLQARPFRVGGRSIQPVDAAATILGKLRRDAEQGVFRGQPLTRTVLTHPARFDVLQRDKLTEAANRAGFTEVLLLPEPVAAALAYERWLAQTGSSVAPGDHILVYDFGGGTFDLAVLAREDDGTFREAIVPEGLSHLGGNDLDTALASHVEDRAIGEIGRSFGTDHDFGYPTIRAARDWKERLTAAQRITASIDLAASSDSQATRYSTQLMRDEFEALIDERFIAPTIRLTLETFARAASLAGSPDRVGVVLIGGGTRVPLIEQRLREVLPVTPHAWDRRDLAVALGAAWHGHRVWANAAPTSTPPPPTTSETRPAPSEPRGTVEPTPSAPEPIEQSAVETSYPDPEPAPQPVVHEQDTDSTTIVVDADGNGDYTSVVEAVAAASSGATILIRKGTYRGEIVLNKSLSLRGDGEPGGVILEARDGNVITSTAQSGLLRHLYIHQTGGEKGSCIEIASGELTVDLCVITSLSESSDNSLYTGAGVMIRNDANPHVRNCHIHSCLQAGVLILDGSSPTIKECTIRANAEAGIVVSSSAGPVLTGNTIRDGRSVGVCIASNSMCLLEGNDIHGNPGCNLTITERSNPDIRNNRIHDGPDGGVIFMESKGTLEGNDIYGNSKYNVLITENSSPIVKENTIHDSDGVGLMVDEASMGIIEDNDVFACKEHGMAITKEGNPTIRGNRIHDNKRFGILVRLDGKGLIEDNDVFENRQGGICIQDAGDPIIRGNRIYKSKGSWLRYDSEVGTGIYIVRDGKGTIEDNDVYENHVGIYVARGEPVVRHNRIHRIRRYALYIGTHTSGVFEFNDLRHNGLLDIEVSMWNRGKAIVRENRTK